MPEERKVLALDARTLRGLAHPLRMQLLVALRNGGPATASQLAEKLGESSGATSYHLRQLAAYGFVEDAPEHGKGRERWWRAAHHGIAIDEKLMRHQDPAVRGAMSVVLHEIATVHSHELATFIGTAHEWSEEWHHAADISDWTLQLTPELARELTTKMHELVQSYSARAVEEGTPGAERVRVHTHLLPTRAE